MNKTALIIITIAFAVSIGIVFSGRLKDDPGSVGDRSAQNVEIRDGVQYVTISARGGYSPKVSMAEANIPTKLIIKTNGTFDCSAALVIRSIGYRKILPQTGEEVIDLGIPRSGTLQGFCSMGMYNFAVDFN